MSEPGPGSLAAGYVCARLDLENSTNLSDQKRLIAEFAEKKGWNLAEWYEEPEQSAVYDVPQQRPVFARLLNDASTRFQVVLCSASMYWSWFVGSAYASLDLLRQLEVWWATADGRWDINIVWQEGFDMVCVLKCVHAVRRDLRKSRTGRKERWVLLILDGKRTLARLTHRSELDVAHTLVRLLQWGYIEQVSRKENDPRSQRDPL